MLFQISTRRLTIHNPAMNSAEPVMAGEKRRWIPIWAAFVSPLKPHYRKSPPGGPPFPRRKPSQNGPRRQGFAAPRRNGAPLTAPGRSEEPFLIRGKGELGTLWPWHLNISLFHCQTTPLLRLKAPAQRLGGWMPKLFAASSSRGRFFS